MDRFIKIRIRLLVILRQVIQFFQQRFAFAFQAIVNPRQTNRIILFGLLLTLGVVQRDDVTLVLHRVITGNILHDVLELWILRDTLIMALEQFRSKRGQIPGLHVGGCVDAIPRQRVVFILLAGLTIFITGWHHDIRRHAFTLRTAAVNTVELLDGVLDGT